jgi:transcriptional regulator with XRE-family HTH domain
MNTIGSKIRLIRLGRGMTQGEVAQKLNMATNTYSRLETEEHRKWDDDMINKIAEVLGVSNADLLSPMPVVMNFHNSPNSCGHVESQTITVSKDVMDMLQKQLEIKDELIRELLSKLTK